MAVIAKKEQIILGDSSNKRRSCVAIPALSTAEYPGVLNLQVVSSGGVVSDKYIFLNAAGTDLRVSTAEDDFSDSGGTSLSTAGADTALSNLVSVQIPNAGDLIPATTNQVDIGTTSAQFKDGWFDGTITVDLLEGDAANIGRVQGSGSNYIQIAASGVMTTEGTSTINGITLTNNSNEIKMTKGNASFEIAAGDTDLIIGAAGSLDVAAGIDVDIDSDVTIGANAAFTTSGSNAIVLDQRLATTASPTFVAITCHGITNTTTVIDSTAQIQIGADNIYMTFGQSDATDSRIYFDGAGNLTLYDSTAGAKTLSVLAAGTPLDPIVVGDLTLGEGMIECDNTQDITSYFKRNNATGTNAVVEIESSHATPTSPCLLLDSDCTADADVLLITNAGTGYSVSSTAAVAGGEGFEFISAASGTGHGLLLDGTTGSAAWIGTGNVGFAEITSDGNLAAGANLLRVASTGSTNVAASFLLELVGGVWAGSTDGTHLRIDDTGATAGTSYSAWIKSTNNNALELEVADVDATALTITLGAANIGDGILVSGDYDGATTRGMISIISTGTHVHADSTLLSGLHSSGAPATSARGSCLRLLDTTSNASDAWMAYFSTTNNDGLLIDTGAVADINLKVSSSAAGTAQMLFVDGVTGTWVGNTNIGMAHIISDGTLAQTSASLLRVAHSGTGLAGSRGSCLSILDTTSNGADTWTAFISTTANDGLLIDTGHIADINLKLTGVTNHEASMMVIAGDTTNGWEGEPNAGMLHINAIGARGDANSSLLLISDITGASVASGRGTSLRIIDATTVGADSWVGYISTTANDGLLIDTGHVDGINLKLSGATASTTQMLHVDGATGSWVGNTDIGMVDLDTDGSLAGGANLLRVESTGTNVADSYVVEIIQSGNLAGATVGGSALRIIESGNAAATTYAVYISSTNNKALHVDSGAVLIDDTLTASGGLITSVDVVNRSAPPLDAEMDTAFGASHVAGEMHVYYDGGAGNAGYFIVSDGTTWYQIAMTVCG